MSGRGKPSTNRSPSAILAGIGIAAGNGNATAAIPLVGIAYAGLGAGVGAGLDAMVSAEQVIYARRIASLSISLRR